MTVAEILSLRRVSHRLVMTEDADLPGILLALLPRVLLKMHHNESTLETLLPKEPDHDLVTGGRAVMENIQLVLKEIVTHSLARVRGLDADLPIPWVVEVASFLSSVCTFDALEQHKSLDIICNSRVLALDLLQEGLLRLYKLQQFDHERISFVLFASLQAIDWFHHRSSLSHQCLEGLFKASWVAMDAIAVGNKHPPLFSFNCYLGDITTCHMRPHAPLLLVPSKRIQVAAAHNGVGVLHFFLDVVLFHPDLSKSVDYNFEQWMRQRSIIAQQSLRAHLQQRGANNMNWSISPSDHPQTNSPEATDVSVHHLRYRLHYRANSDKIASVDEVRKETRNIKLACYRYVSLLFNDAGNATSIQRALVLAVIARSDQCLSKEGEAQFRILMSSMQGLQRICHFNSENGACNEYMTSLVSSLLILVLAKDNVTRLRQNMLAGASKMEWEDILGPAPLIQDHKLTREAVLSILEFTKEHMFVSESWQSIKAGEEIEEINKKFSIDLLFEVARDAIGMANIYADIEEEPLYFLQQYLQRDEASLHALGAGLFRKLSEKLLVNHCYSERFGDYFNFVLQIINLTTCMYCTFKSCENDHPTPPSRFPDIISNNVDVKSNLLDSQWLPVPARFRGECYHFIGAYMQYQDALAPVPSDLVFFKIPGNLLICMLAEDDEILKEIISVSLHNVLLAYEAHLVQDSTRFIDDECIFRLADLFPIILSASCSYNPLTRLSAVKCVSGMIRFFDQPTSRLILTFLLDDVSPQVANASSDGISLISSTVTSISPCPEKSCDLQEHFDSSKGKDMKQISIRPHDLRHVNSISDKSPELNDSVRRKSSMRCRSGLDCPVVAKHPLFHAKEHWRIARNSDCCSLCGSLPHFPAQCTDISQWNAFYNDRPLPDRIFESTNLCAGCNSRMVKTHGCNLMKCTKCEFEFCWICCKRISPYFAHACHKYDHNLEETKTFYMRRYEANHNAEKFALDQLNRLHDNAGSQMQLPLFLGENFEKGLEQSIKALISCRKFLKYSYVRVYIMRENEQGQNLSLACDAAQKHCYVEKHLSRFEKLQSALQMHTESLNKLTETDNEDDTMRYGVKGIPLYLRSLSVYTQLVLDLMSQLEDFLTDNRSYVQSHVNA